MTSGIRSGWPHMYRLGILPQGYIYPKEHHPKRDLPCRRLLFVRHRTSHILSLQSMVTKNLGLKMSNNDIKKLKVKDAEGLFDSSNLAFLAKNYRISQKDNQVHRKASKISGQAT
jgi:hypothetical protein